jgi:hypothetical protein
MVLCALQQFLRISVGIVRICGRKVGEDGAAVDALPEESRVGKPDNVHAYTQ